MAAQYQPINRGRIYFLVPMYNEAENLEQLFENLTTAPKHGRTPFYVFSDDGSSDGSTEKVMALFPKDSVHVVGDGQNYGPGHAFNAGFEWILEHSENENDVVVTMEADNTSDIGILPQMLTIFDTGYDLVLASVYVQSGGFDKTSFLRKFISFGGNMLLRMTLGIKVLTLSSFYRVYSLSLLRQIQTKHRNLIAENGFICMVEILLKAIRLDAKIIEVPMTLRSEARQGKSKMKILNTTWDYLKFMGKNMFKK